MIAALNIARKGGDVFHRSQGLVDEAMKANVEKEPLMLRVDVSKLSH